MSHRIVTNVDLRTGEVVTTETSTTATNLTERVAGMAAEAREHLLGEIEAGWANILCDGCGAVVTIDLNTPALPDGWSETDHGDFCPDCTHSM